ncbi:hypothetical protein O9G_006340, partial [Rozella allomycis CSF55]
IFEILKSQTEFELKRIPCEGASEKIRVVESFNDTSHLAELLSNREHNKNMLYIASRKNEKQIDGAAILNNTLYLLQSTVSTNHSFILPYIEEIKKKISLANKDRNYDLGENARFTFIVPDYDFENWHYQYQLNDKKRRLKNPQYCDQYVLKIENWQGKITEMTKRQKEHMRKPKRKVNRC